MKTLKKYLSSPWVITIIGGIVVVVVCYYFLGIGKNSGNNTAYNTFSQNQQGGITVGHVEQVHVSVVTQAQAPTIEKRLIYKNQKNQNDEYETRYLVSINSPEVSLGYLMFNISPVLTATRVDILSLDLNTSIVSSSGAKESLSTGHYWERVSNPFGRFRVTIYSKEVADFSLTFKSDKEIQIKEE